MRVALELPHRQAARILEQALRQQPEFLLEMGRGDDLAELRARLVERDGDLLAAELIDAPADLQPDTLIGLYFDARVNLSDQLYLFTSTLIECGDGPPARILFSEPETITVVNRRRFERTNATIAAQARFFFNDEGQGFLGLLSSISGSGLAANLPDDACNAVALVGDRVRVRFELPGFEGDFELPGVLCSKDLDRKNDQTSLGVEFDVQGDAGAAEDLQRLRACLAEMTINLTD